MEEDDSVLLSQWLMDFEAGLEKTFKQLQLFRFLVERRHCCRERLRQFGNSVNIVMEVCRIVVVCQLLEGQQKTGLLQSSQVYSHCGNAVDW